MVKLPIQIAIIDDQNIFRQSLALLIERVEDFFLIGDYADGKEFLTALPLMRQLPDVVLVDMDMPGMNGIELNSVLHETYRQIKVIILSVHAQERLMAKMIIEGAAAYLIKNCDKDELISAVRSVYHAGFYINKLTLIAIQNNALKTRNQSGKDNLGLFSLTKREKEILRLICLEYGNPEIAEKLFISVRTVEGHRNNLMIKTTSKNTAGLVLYAVKNQLFDVFS